MERVNKLFSPWKLLWFKWKSLRSVPFRKKYFVGYDLNGNKYWEFYTDSDRTMMGRRLWEPYKEQAFMVDYYDKLPVQWLQWLRKSRKQAPTIEELLQDEKRIERLHRLVAAKDAEMVQKKALAEQAEANSLYKELDKVTEEKAQQAAADKAKNDEPIEAWKPKARN